jgi:hypothetical protein
MNRLLALLAGALALGALVLGAACDLTDVDVDGNLPPYIERIDVSDPIAMRGRPVELAMTVTDPEGDSLRFQWDSTGGDLEYDGPVATFTGDADRDFIVRGLTSDSHTIVYQDTTIRVVDFFDGFETWGDGTPPGPPWWTVTTAGEPTPIVQVTTGIAHDGGAALEFQDFGPGSRGIAFADLTTLLPTKAAVVDAVVRFHIYLDGDGFVARCYDLPGTESTHLVWELRFGNGRVYAVDPEGPTAVADVDRDRWIEARVAVDLDGKQWAFTLDGQAGGGAFEMPGTFTGTTPRCEGLEFSTVDVNEPGNFYLDDIVVTRDPEF